MPHMLDTLNIPAVKRDLFLRRLRETGQIARSCEDAGVDRSKMYKRRSADPEFDERWIAALEGYADDLEAEAHRRAVAGTDKGVWHQGVQVGTERQYSDSLLSQMLKAKRREYRDKLEMGNADDKPFETADNHLAVARNVALLFAIAAKRAAAGELPAPDSGEDMC